MTKINIHEYLSEYGMTVDLASISPLQSSQIRSAIANLRLGKMIHPSTKRHITEAINKREPHLALQINDIEWYLK